MEPDIGGGQCPPPPWFPLHCIILTASDYSWWNAYNKDGSFPRRRIESASKINPRADPIRRIDSANGSDPPPSRIGIGPDRISCDTGYAFAPSLWLRPW